MKPLCYTTLLLLIINSHWGLLAQGLVPSTGGTVTGTTIAQGDDCALSLSNDYYFSFTPDVGCSNLSYSFSLCNTPLTWDSQIYILDNMDCATANVIAFNDDACAGLSAVTADLTGGVTYYIYIEGFFLGFEGDFTLDVNVVSGTPAPPLNGDYYLLGDATTAAEPDCYVLTQNTSNQATCVWNSNTVNFNQAFSYNYTVNLGSSDAGADGIALVFQNDANGICACGGSGGNMAYGGIANSLIFEIDTYMNTEDRDDFTFPCIAGSCSDPDHVAIHLNGDWVNAVLNAMPLMDGTTEYNIENGNDHQIIVNWDGTSTITFTVTDETQTITLASLAYTFDPLSLFGTNTPNLGFTSSTGSLTNVQSICDTNSDCSFLPAFIR